MIPIFWFRWLQILTIVMILFGAMMLVTPDVTLGLFSMIFYGEPGGFQARYPAEAIEYMRFIHGDLGSTIVGWGVTAYLALNGPFRRVDSGGWIMLVTPLVVWFVTGAGYSIYAGFWRNAVFNTLFLVLYSIPLLATRKCFNGKS